MKGIRGRKRAITAALVGVGGVVTVFALVVLPALAAPGRTMPPPSVPKNVLPVEVNTGGQSNDCAVFYGTGGNRPSYQYRIDNPKSGSYTTTVDGVQVTFTLTTNPPKTAESLAYAKDKYVSFTVSGAKVVDVGIKGGTNTTRYGYGTSGPGYVTDGDGYLHAPAQTVDSSGNPTQLYSISNLTFCFNLSSVSGTVFRDANDNSVFDQGEPGQQNWTVRMYSGSTLLATKTTGSDGKYSFTLPLQGTFRLCEAPPSGTWAQTVPTTGTATCSGVGELSKGYSITGASNDVVGEDFGNHEAIGLCSTPFGIPGSYEIHLAEPCKTNQLFVVNFSDAAGNKFASVRPVNTSLPKIPMIEKITWSFTGTTQNAFTLEYDDVLPYSTADSVPMPFCKLDPRLSGSEFAIDPNYDTVAESGAVLPGTDTSCLIAKSASVGSGGAGKTVYYIYSSIDGWRDVT